MTCDWGLINTAKDNSIRQETVAYRKTTGKIGVLVGIKKHG